MVLALIAALVAAVVIVVWAVWPEDDSPAFTWHGTEIATPQQVLEQAEAAVNEVVAARHGATNEQTRCYFALPKKSGDGATSSDVQGEALCGPVLFVDGNVHRTYLPVRLKTDGTENGKQALAAVATAKRGQPEARPDDVALRRPDNAEPPAGSGDLRVPAPPPADSDLLAVVPLGPTPKPPALDGAVLIGRSSGLAVTAAGEIPRYGAGDAARSAPDGHRLIAFRVEARAGDVHPSGAARLEILVTGGGPRPLPAIGPGWIVVAVPESGTAKLELTDAGFTQTLRLPDGAPGPGNLKVLARTNRAANLREQRDVAVGLRDSKGATADITWNASLGLTTLDFWVPGHESAHASSGAKAILTPRITYTDDGQTYGFNPELLTLRLPDGTVVPARNVAKADNGIFNVFEVPAGFTRGTLIIAGSQQLGDVTATVKRPVSLPIRLPAG